jgi:LuxR family maltose regulon positive regulatory protein
VLRLAAALAGQDPPVTLVLDDLHLLTDPTALDGLDYLLRKTGPGLRLLAAARMDPPLPLHRHRLAGELTEIRAPGVPDPAYRGLGRRPAPARDLDEHPSRP